MNPTSLRYLTVLLFLTLSACSDNPDSAAGSTKAQENAPAISTSASDGAKHSKNEKSQGDVQKGGAVTKSDEVPSGKVDSKFPSQKTNESSKDLSPSQGAVTEASSTGDNYWIGVTLLLGGALLLSLFVMIGLLRWRKVTVGGMMALAPASLMDSLTEHQNRALKSLDKNLSDAHKRIVEGLIVLDEGQQRHQESVKLLDSELTKKDKVIKDLTKVAVNEHRDQYVRTVSKLTTFMESLKQQVRQGKLSAEDAMDFLSDELQESILEVGVQIFSPPSGAEYRTLKAELCEVQNLTELSDKDLTALVVLEVRRKGIFRVEASTGELIIYRKAEIRLGTREES